jgi:hypothetical protein
MKYKHQEKMADFGLQVKQQVAEQRAETAKLRTNG